MRVTSKVQTIAYKISGQLKENVNSHVSFLEAIVKTLNWGTRLNFIFPYCICMRVYVLLIKNILIYLCTIFIFRMGTFVNACVTDQ